MLSNGEVRFVQQDPHGGEQVTALGEDLFRVLVAQAHSLEELRVLWFGFCVRADTANAKRKRMAAAAGGAL